MHGGTHTATEAARVPVPIGRLEAVSLGIVADRGASRIESESREPAVTEGPQVGRRGIRESALRVVAHMRALTQLEKALAQSELKRKGATAGAGAGIAVAAVVFMLFAIGFGLATAAAALALVVDWWLALLIVFALLVLLVLVLLLVSRNLFRAGTPLKPEQAIEESRLTRQVLRGGSAR